ncbi:MAG: hypothetical protein DRG55_01350 [Deltaproteobacteria bacterium]|nr:MAG: hypothetical protein DRG69_05620 [Deltaproteobacteria bacterium]RLB03027.1 MAG: hypothetical protein DRG55_01350 [Deltaproteobacteria bacterium]
MPRGDGTGPPGGLGRGSGRGRGGRGWSRGMGRGLGPGGQCVCPQCGASVPHKPGVPCFQVPCPKCGTPMLRKG